MCFCDLEEGFTQVGLQCDCNFGAGFTYGCSNDCVCNSTHRYLSLDGFMCVESCRRDQVGAIEQESEQRACDYINGQP